MECPRCGLINPDSALRCDCGLPLPRKESDSVACTGTGSVAAEGCRNCGSTTIEPGYEVGLCVTCRDVLAKRAFPYLIRLMFAVILVVVILATSRTPETLRAGIAFERAQKAEIAGDYLRAVTEYRRVAERFPDSTLSLARLGIAYYQAGQHAEAVKTLEKISGRKTSQELASEVNRVLEEIGKAGKPQ